MGGGVEVGREDIYMDMIREISIRKILIRVAPQLPANAKMKKIHKDSFSALTLGAFVCKNVAF